MTCKFLPIGSDCIERTPDAFGIRNVTLLVAISGRDIQTISVLSERVISNVECPYCPTIREQSFDGSSADAAQVCSTRLADARRICLGLIYSESRSDQRRILSRCSRRR